MPFYAGVVLQEYVVSHSPLALSHALPRSLPHALPHALPHDFHYALLHDHQHVVFSNCLSSAIIEKSPHNIIPCIIMCIYKQYTINPIMFALQVHPNEIFICKTKFVGFYTESRKHRVYAPTA